MFQSQSNRATVGHPDMGNPNPVAHPTQKVQSWLSIYKWTDEEIKLLKKMYPDPCVTSEDIQEFIPWRSRNAIWLKASRLGLEVNWGTP